MTNNVAKLISIVGVNGMALISGIGSAWIVSIVASILILSNKEAKHE